MIPEAVEIVDCEGIRNIPDKFASYLLLKRPQIKAVGIVVDADENITSRWESYKDLLRESGYIVPDKLVSTGTIIRGEERNPDVGIWIMPDNQQAAGMLENFFLSMVPDSDQLLPIVIQTLDHIEKQGLNPYQPLQRAKVEVHTWLAWQETPGATLGLAIKKSYLNHQAESGVSFVKWYTSLFVK